MSRINQGGRTAAFFESPLRSREGIGSSWGQLDPPGRQGPIALLVLGLAVLSAAGAAAALTLMRI
jgi:hypothetical protein